MKRKIIAMILAPVCCLLAGGCNTVSDDNPFQADNNIASYHPIDTSKTVITLGQFLSVDLAPLEEKIEAHFPEVEIVVTKKEAGYSYHMYEDYLAKGGDLPDIILSSHKIGENDYLYDLATESFVEHYQLTALNALNVNGSLYQIPLTSSAFGIFYNKTLFEKNGWEIPADLDAFYTLCETIEQSGVRPFAPCFKYFSTLEDVGIGLSYEKTLKSANSLVAYDRFAHGLQGCEGLIEPMLTVLKGLYDKGLVTDADFTSSATENRKALYAGEIAMIPYNLDFASFYHVEKPACEIGLFAYPTSKENDQRIKMSNSYTASLSRKAMEDPKKQQILLAIFDYMSTPEGQEILIECLGGLSNVKGVGKGSNEAFPAIYEAVEDGRIYYMDYFGKEKIANGILEDWMSGKTGLEQTLKALNEIPKAKLKNSFSEEPLTIATEDFTILQTSLLVADVMQEKTKSEISLLPNNTFFKGNLAQLFAGELRTADLFYLKSLTKEDVLTTYEISGANLKALLEHPKLSGEAEGNFLYAFSGLSMDYAPLASPLASPSANVRRLTLADGTELADSKLYTVTAWRGTIDEQYIDGVRQTFPALGTNEDLMANALAEMSEITPAKDGRLTLFWDKS